MSIHFIPKEVVLTIQRDQVEEFGGTHGIRDENLLESALSQPKATFGGKYLHETIFDKAAAYGFHLCKNHPFIDGNKRVAFLVMYMFLRKNGWILKASEKDAYAAMMDTASGNLSKKKLSEWLKEHTEKS